MKYDFTSANRFTQCDKKVSIMDYELFNSSVARRIVGRMTTKATSQLSCTFAAFEF